MEADWARSLPGAKGEMNMRKKTSCGLSVISRHRQPIYGVAALWILLLHLRTQIPLRGLLAVPSLLQRFGACGVEIFCLMSGFGVYRSLERDPRALPFYRKRFARVFLPAFLVMATYLTLRAVPPARAIPLVTFFPYWWGAETVWYVPFILTMYLIYPLLFRLQRSRSKLLTALFVLSAVCTVAGAVAGLLPQRLDRSLHRIPVFLLGCVLAPWINEDRQVSRPVLLGVIAAGAAALASLCFFRYIDYAYPYWMRTCLYTLLAAAVIVCTALASEWLARRGGAGAAVYRFLAFFGMISLECYLLFTRWKDLLELWLPADAADRVLLIDLGSLLFTVLGGLLLTRLCALIRDTFAHLPVPSPKDPQQEHPQQAQR